MRYTPNAQPVVCSFVGTPSLSKSRLLRLNDTAFQKVKHPLSQLGGYQMPSVGAIGGLKDAARNLQNSKTGVKRSGSQSAEVSANKSQKLSAEEEVAIAKREAARARVQSRTMQAFGLG